LWNVELVRNVQVYVVGVSNWHSAASGTGVD
jgi:hypothetical protein